MVDLRNLNLVKASVLSLGVVATAVLPAAAIPYGTNSIYRVGSDLIISSTPGSQVSVGLGATVKNRAFLAGYCGEVKVNPGTTPPATITVGTRTLTLANLPTQLLPKCVNGQFEESRNADFKTAAGQIIAVGFTPSQSVTVGIPTPINRRVSINGCGFGSLQNVSGTLAINGQSYIMSSLPNAGIAPICRASNGVSTGYIPSTWP